MTGTHSLFDPPTSPTLNEFVDFLDKLPESTNYNWELAITDIIERVENCRSLCNQVLENGVPDGYDAEEIRFTALFTLCTYLRRQDHHGLALQYLDEYDEFSKRPMYAHIRSMVITNYEDKVRNAQMAAETARPHSGASHNLAKLIVDGLEEGKSLPLEEPKSIAKEHLDIALKNADYPKHLATKGLLLALEGEFNRAKKRIREARDRENEDQENYAVRLSEYQEYLFRVRVQKYEEKLRSEIEGSYTELSGSIQEMEEKAEELEDYFSDLRTQTLQFIGFFATLLAVIITSAQFATQVAAETAAPLIMIMIGGLLAAIGGFSYTLPSRADTKDAVRRQLIPIGLGFLLLLSGLVLLYLVPFLPGQS